MTGDEANPRPDELEDRLDDIMQGGAKPPAGGGSGVSTEPDESASEHESMAVADSDHEQDPDREQAGGAS